MKKIIYTLLVAVMALSFMGCPTVYEDLKFEELVPTPAYIMGDMAGEAKAMEVNGNVATYTFKYSATERAWSSPVGTISFKVSAKLGPDGKSLDWDNAWSDAVLTLNGEAVETEAKNKGNNTCEGLTDGEEYTITVTAGRKGVSIAISGKAGDLPPSLYVLDTDNGPIKMEFDGTTYKYTTIAKGSSVELPLWVNDTFLTGEFTVGTDKNAKEMKIEEKADVLVIKGTEENYKYEVAITYDGEKATVMVTKGKLVKKVDIKAIVGSITGGEWTAFEDETLTYTFTYDGAGDSWADGAANQVSFKVSVSATQDWDAVNYGGTDFAVGDEDADLKLNPGMDNSVITGLVKDKKYKVTITCTEDEKVLAKCEVVE